MKPGIQFLLAKPKGSVCIFVTSHQIYNKIGISHYCKEDLEIFNE
jgi:hypothetical protein